MVPPQAALQTDQPQKQKRRGKFPRWVLIVVIIFALLFLIGGAVFWILKVWGNLSDTLAATFTVLGTIFGFIALVPPLFQYLRDRQASSPTHTTTAPDNNQGDSTQLPPLQNKRAANKLLSTPLAPSPHDRPPTHSSPAKDRNVLNDILHHRIIQVLESIPTTATFEGRTTLLTGIPQNIIRRLNRDRNNDANDLANLLSQIDGLSPLTTGERPLIIFIQNTINNAEGLRASGDLSEVLEELKLRYEGSSQQDPEPPVNPPGPSNKPDKTGKGDLTKPSQNAPFLDWAYYYITNAKEETKDAHSSLTASYVNPTEYINKFDSLGEIKKSFEDFLIRIDDTPQLPPEITLSREQLRVNVKRAIEQIKAVQLCIQEWESPCNDIKGKFKSLLQILGELGRDCKLKDQ